MITIETTSSMETQAVAERIAGILMSGDIILMSGDLGAGKTTFTQGLGRALGITQPITSPTFILVRSYEGRLKLHHVDVYRLDQLQEIIDLGLGEMLDDGGVAVVEWGEMAAPVLPADYLTIRLHHRESDDDRLMEIAAVGESWSNRLPGLRSALADWITT